MAFYVLMCRQETTHSFTVWTFIMANSTDRVFIDAKQLSSYSFCHAVQDEK